MIDQVRPGHRDTRSTGSVDQVHPGHPDPPKIISRSDELMPSSLLHCHSIRILYVLDASFSNSQADFCCFIWVLFEPFPYYPQSSFSPSLFHFISILGTLELTASSVLDLLPSKLFLWLPFSCIWVRLIGAFIPKPGPRFIFRIGCIGYIDRITELAIKLRQVGKQTSLQSSFVTNFKRNGPGKLQLFVPSLGWHDDMIGIRHARIRLADTYILLDKWVMQNNFHHGGDLTCLPNVVH